MGAYVVLLRAIGPMTHKVMSMADWRAACEAEGFGAPETYVATGNMIVESGKTLAEMTKAMNRIVRQLGLGENNNAIVRKPGTLKDILRSDPFPDAAAQRPERVGVYFFFGARPDFGWIGDHEGPERIHVQGMHLIVDYGEDHTQSLRLPRIIEKRSGVVTARNWNTVRGLAERCAARGGAGR
ncbi:DUF1697 domain-containing protein [Pelagibacterium limicola]|uniref:DUF1697 domain-containing protein n=1 Tax=Pelagibacterium limicola TaxID=2791022 RepID=UPI0018AFEB79|nr:DUF1697 domain-containing protein [Pelagibacterium limicola]